jgi:hypothetical protein
MPLLTKQKTASIPPKTNLSKTYFLLPKKQPPKPQKKQSYHFFCKYGSFSRLAQEVLIAQKTLLTHIHATRCARKLSQPLH